MLLNPISDEETTPRKRLVVSEGNLENEELALLPIVLYCHPQTSSKFSNSDRQCSLSYSKLISLLVGVITLISLCKGWLFFVCLVFQFKAFRKSLVFSVIIEYNSLNTSRCMKVCLEPHSIIGQPAGSGPHANFLTSMHKLHWSCFLSLHAIPQDLVSL